MAGLDSTLSLADLTDAGLSLRSTHAAAIARAVTLRAASGELPGVPSPNVLRFASDGTIAIEGPVAAGRSVERAARLLEAMLPPFDAPGGHRAPGALRLVLGRATGVLDLPPYGSLEAFADALQRFATPDAAVAVREIWAEWSASRGTDEPVVEDRELTISDVRRARRSTGLTLTDVSHRSRIPVSLLRELEWGYFVNWPGGHYGRTQLVRYAHAAGIDEQVVIAAVWPVLEEAVRSRLTRTVVVDGAIVDDAGAAQLVRIEPALPAARQKAPSWRSRALTWGAIPALVAISLVPVLWNAGDPDEPPVVQRTDGPAVPAVPAARVTPGAADKRPSARAPIAVPRPAAVPQEPIQIDAGYSPAFASTGSATFYHSGTSGERSAIMRADSTAPGNTIQVTRVVDDGSSNFHARPSPDGQFIAFDSDREGERAVYVADADGRHVRRVTGEGFAAVPSWSPDGRRLAVVRAEAGRPRVWNLWTVDVQSGAAARLTFHRVGQPWGAAWFPDGERIAYSHEDRLIVRGVDGSQERVYPTPVKGRLVRTPAVSPDGRYVVFQVYRDGAWLLDLDDGSTRRILTDPTAEEFSWAPDGRRVAYHSRKTGNWGVWIMAAR